MVNSAWYDVGVRGRRLEAIAKHCNTKYWKCVETNDEMAEAYFDRLMKIEKAIQPYVAEFTGVKKLLKAGNKIETLPECIP
jgi:hypothetical protein